MFHLSTAVHVRFMMSLQAMWHQSRVLKEGVCVAVLRMQDGGFLTNEYLCQLFSLAAGSIFYLSLESERDTIDTSWSFRF